MNSTSAVLAAARRAAPFVVIVLLGLVVGVGYMSARARIENLEHNLMRSEGEAFAYQRLGTSAVGCSERGGVIARGAFGATYCKVTFPDAGRSCSDMSECLGGCTAPANQPTGAEVKGICKAENRQSGCTGYVVHGRVSFSECID